MEPAGIESVTSGLQSQRSLNGVLLERTPYRPSTYWSTELRELGETDPTSDGSGKPQLRLQTDSSPYRTQEVAGSSPASSTFEALHVRGFFDFGLDF
jgi:hypothetical protein